MPKEAEGDNDREPDPPHAHLGLGWLAGVYQKAAGSQGRRRVECGSTRGGVSKERKSTPNWRATIRAASVINELLGIGAAAVRAYPVTRLHAVDAFLAQLCFRAAFAASDVAVQAVGAQPRHVEMNLGVPLPELHKADGVAHRCHRPAMLAPFACASLASTFFSACHAARCVACQGVGSPPVPVALVGEC